MPRVLVVLPTQTYRASDFMKAGDELGVDLVVASEAPPPIDMGDRYLQIDCSDPIAAAEIIVRAGDLTAIDGVVAADDSGVEIAALAGTRLGLAANPPEAARAARNKETQRLMFRAGEVPQPKWEALPAGVDPAEAALRVGYPAVVKPLDRSASQGVLRVDHPAQLTQAIERIRSIVGNDSRLLIERFVEGNEVAVEGIIGPSGFNSLAIFDKPSPMAGEGFQETMLVTPSRHSTGTQKECLRVATMAISALGLSHGPVHIELMVKDDEVIVLEVAARSIGGLCSKSLRFGLMDTSLESLILRNALGLDKPELRRKANASGVLMIPIPDTGALERIEGLDRVRAIEGITAIEITAREGDLVTPPPEGDRYLGFVFANAPRPDQVETALTRARDAIEVKVRSVDPQKTQ